MNNKALVVLVSSAVLIAGLVWISLDDISLATPPLEIRKTSHVSPNSRHTNVHRVEDLRLSLSLPEEWRLVKTVQGSLTIRDELDQPTYVFVELEPLYYNPLAKSLKDYEYSYRGKDIDVVVDSSEHTTVDAVLALLQLYRAGDLVDGELTSTSLASVGPSHRYVLQHPSSGRFVIVSYKGGGNPEILQEVVARIQFDRS